jgi:hypothetical protein
MIPVNNVKYGHLQVGDTWKGEKIVALRPCPNSENCRTRYKNFDASCGGYERILVHSEDFSWPSNCPFFKCSEDNTYLTDTVEGRPLL